MTNYEDPDKYNRCIEDIGELLRQTVRTCQVLERQQIRTHGFTSSQCYILLEILKAESMTINEISLKMGLEISTITRIMDNLVRDGLVVRTRSPRDKRIVEALLTEAGRREAIKLRNSIHSYYQNIISLLPAGHVREVMSATQQLLTAVVQAGNKDA
ncbi:MarR family winged helix-turn-helix transcriptional regulator [Sporomusa aerivorans]|uniref:MarR family winged helix-turn-helix transcriptional regulator n=1 Tax=Sporomusa aerivorans TaxID=204936 RepID=UPI00352AA86C